MRKIMILMFLITFGINAQTKINGVITYYFNEYQGDKVDLGAKVILLDSAKTKIMNFDLYNKYLKGKSARNRFERWTALYNEARKKDKAEYKTHLDETIADMKLYDSETQEKFDELDNLLSTNVITKLSTEKVFEKTIDNSGSYSFDVNPGTYYICIISKNRDEATKSEVLGLVYIEKIKILKDEVKDVSHNFKN